MRAASEGRSWTVLAPLAVLAAVMWQSFLFSSLWLDEAVSAWIVSGSASEAFFRSITFQGQSPFYYLILWSWAQFFGAGELSLRIPSTLALLGALYAVWRWSGRQFGGTSAAAAAVALLSMDVVLSAMSARPYAFALLFAVLSLRAFSKLEHERQSATWLRATAFLVLATYSHYLFAFAGFIGILLAGKAIGRSVSACIAAGVVCLPGAFQLLGLFGSRASLRFVDAPNAPDLLRVMVPPGFGIPLFVALCVVLVMFARRSQQPLAVDWSRAKIAGFLFWWAVPPVLLWTAALLGPALFVGRYVMWCMPGAALALASFVSMIRPAAAQRVFVIVMSVLVVCLSLDRKWQVEDWRAAYQAVGQIDACRKPEAYLLLHSGLIELEDQTVSMSEMNWPYLNAPHGYYAKSLQAPVAAVPLAAAELPKLAARLTAAHPPCAVLLLDKKLPPTMAGQERLRQTTSSLAAEAFSRSGWKRIMFSPSSSGAQVLLYAVDG